MSDPARVLAGSCKILPLDFGIRDTPIRFGPQCVGVAVPFGWSPQKCGEAFDRWWAAIGQRLREEFVAAVAKGPEALDQVAVPFEFDDAA